MSGLDRLGEQIAAEQDALRSRSPDRALVRERIATMPLREAPKRARNVGLALACAACVAATLALWARPLGREPLTLAVGQSQKIAPVGTFIEAPKLEALGLHFSDGTRIQMAPRSRARLVALESTGAHLLLESGEAHLAVVHKPHASWRVSVGPFLVRVTGTRFAVRWNPEQDRFELDLEDGHVEVSGCVFGQGYRMAAGQVLSASCEERRFDVTDRRQLHASKATPKPSEQAEAHVDAPQASATPVSEARPSSAAEREDRPAKVASRARTAAPSQSDVRRGASWLAPAARGKYATAFAAAKASGFEAACARASADQLALLADAARYSREPEDESYALHLLRRRFSGTRRAALAAFALGRLEFDAHRAYDEAAEWFGTYLTEQPSGPLAREARGRLMESTLATGDRARARELALRYLREYPGGPHAEIARGLISGVAP